MKFADILEKHVYNVIFDKVRDNEFDGTHLALVIKKNNDKKTAIVLPLTKGSNGDGSNKINVGRIASLPNNLKTVDSYAVYNQVRTVNHSRFMALKNDDGEKVQCPIDNNWFNALVALCANELVNSLSNEDAGKYHYSRYVELTVKEIVEISYEIKRAIKDKKEIEEIIPLVNQIVSLVDENIVLSDHLGSVEIQNGILEIINKCIDNSLLEELFSKKVANKS